jgi:hypothetical protein
MWRLRHRLIVTYIFIGFIPIVLLLLMAGIGSYLLAGQFATYIAISNLQSGLQHLEAANDALAAQLRTLELSGKLNKQIAGELTTASGENFPQRTVTVWRDENGLILSTGGVLLEARPAKVPDVIKGDFSGFVIDQDSLHLRAVKRPADSFLPPKGSWGPPVDCRRGSSFFAPEPPSASSFPPNYCSTPIRDFPGSV